MSRISAAGHVVDIPARELLLRCVDDESILESRSSTGYFTKRRLCRGQMVMNAAVTRDPFRLDGRVALVTGASGGIGSSIAESLSGAGARVALHGSSEATLAAIEQRLRGLDREVVSFPLDLTKAADVVSLVPTVIETFGSLDILVNCAGINRRQPTVEVTQADYEQIMAINLRAPFLLSQGAAVFMAEHGGGRIVNVGSISGELGLSGISVYEMSKAGLRQMTRQMAVEWAPHNIQVNCVLPGFLKTKLTETVWADNRRRRWMLKHIPLGRAGDSSEVASVVLFLASPASSYVTGVSVAVDGGVLAGIPGYAEGDT